MVVVECEQDMKGDIIELKRERERERERELERERMCSGSASERLGNIRITTIMHEAMVVYNVKISI